MTVTRNTSIDTNEVPNALQLAYGEITLVAGLGSENVPSFPASANLQLTRRQAGGVIGHLAGAYSAGVISVASSSGTDTSIVAWMLTA